LPRGYKRLEGLVDGISPKNVHFVFRPTIEKTLNELEGIVATQLAFGTNETLAGADPASAGDKS
jgi:hypothetical protein